MVFETYNTSGSRFPRTSGGYIRSVGANAKRLGVNCTEAHGFEIAKRSPAEP
jgi:hypothetical protein